MQADRPLQVPSGVPLLKPAGECGVVRPCQHGYIRFVRVDHTIGNGVGITLVIMKYAKERYSAQCHFALREGGICRAGVVPIPDWRILLPLVRYNKPSIMGLRGLTSEVRCRMRTCQRIVDVPVCIDEAMRLRPGAAARSQ